MANNIFLKREDACVPNGWNKWLYVNNYDESSSIAFPDAPFPSGYLSAKAFWLESVISHCCITWEFSRSCYCPDDETDTDEDPTDCYKNGKYVYGIGLGPRETPATFCTDELFLETTLDFEDEDLDFLNDDYNLTKVKDGDPIVWELKILNGSITIRVTGSESDDSWTLSLHNNCEQDPTGSANLFGSSDTLDLARDYDDFEDGPNSSGEFDEDVSRKGRYGIKDAELSPYPQMGYCLGDIFKQHIYCHLELEETCEDDTCPQSKTVVRLEGTPKPQVIQNSRLKKIYIYQGKLKGYYNKPVKSESGSGSGSGSGSEEGSESEEQKFESILLTDIPPYALQEDLETESVILTVTSPPKEEEGGENGESQTDSQPVELRLTLKKIRKDGSFEIEETLPLSNGDDIAPCSFYQLECIYVIEDPYLLSGFYEGTEDEVGSSSGVNSDAKGCGSGLNLYLTTHNSPYEEGKLLGVYIPTDFTCSISSPNMNDIGTNEWCFFWFDENTNEIYKGGTRYKEAISVPETDECGSLYKDQIGSYVGYSERCYAPLEDLEEFKKHNNYVRVEIETGGWRDRHNWFQGCLTGEYIKWDDAYFEILQHITFNIIDVAKYAVDGVTEFDPNGSDTYEIINQNGWMINEHYDGDIFNCTDYEEDVDWPLVYGVFHGTVSSAKYDESYNVTRVDLEVDQDFCGAWIKNHDPTLDFPAEGDVYVDANNFMNRFRDDMSESLSSSGRPKRFYKKYQNWQLVMGNTPEDSQNQIVEFEIDPDQFNLSSAPDWPEANEEYSIEVILKGNVADAINVLISSSDQAFISFDKTFKTLCWPEETGNFYLDFGKDLGNTTSSSCQDLGRESPLCLDGGYISNQYLIDLPDNTRISYCEGDLFGIDADAVETYECYDDGESVKRLFDMYLHITTVPCPITETKSISTIFHEMQYQDWILYEDVNNQKLQIRKGSDDLRSRPVKQEVGIGEASAKDFKIGDTIDLDTDEDRLNRLSFEVPTGEEPLEFTIVLSNGESKAGFGIIGAGETQLKEYLGEDVPKDSWVDSRGGPISPIYVNQKEADTESKQTANFYLGTRTDISELKVEGLAESGEGGEGGEDGEDGAEGAKAFYFKGDKTISKGMGFFGMHRLSDGQTLILFNQPVGAFEVGKEYPIFGEPDSSETGAIENSQEEGNVWDSRTGIMAISTFNDGVLWGTPVVNLKGDQPPDRLMIMNSVEYYGSFYDELNQVICVFAKCFAKEQSSGGGIKEYIGIFKIPYLFISHKAYECTPTDDSSGSYKGNCCDSKSFPIYRYGGSGDSNNWEY
jgi:hypothetical protein